MKKILAAFLGIAAISSGDLTSSELGLAESYDINLQQKRPADNNLMISGMFENAFKIQGFSTDEKEEESIKVNSLQIYECTQNLLAMYKNIANVNSEYLQLLNNIVGGAGGGAENQENGLFNAEGDFYAKQAAISGTYAFNNNFYLSTHIPFYSVSLENVKWKYTGNNKLFSGAQIQQLADNFSKDALNLFKLDTGCWKKSHIGDITTFIEWEKSFPQLRPILKNVQPILRAGLSIPTGSTIDENKLMSIPFGSDGSFTIPFGGGLTINLAERLDLGFNAQFSYKWSSCKNRRIKTFPTQTTLLFPKIIPTLKKYALTQKFNLHAKIYNSSKKFSLKGCYQYFRKGEDKIFTTIPGYDYDVTNSAKNLSDRSSHNLLFTLNYSPASGDFEKIVPQAEIFYKYGFNGMRSNVSSTIGAQLSLIF